MFNLEDYLKDLAEICAMDTGRYNKEGVYQIRDWFETRYQELGFRTQTVCMPGREEAPVLMISNIEDDDLQGSSEKFDVLFISHLDTVFDTETVKNWPMTVDEKGIGSAPGCIDCKGGSLLILYLLREMLKAKELGFKFLAAMNSDEEPGSNYSQPYFEQLAERTTYCLVFEPGRANDEFVGVRKGGVKYVLKAHGIGAHSGADFEKGANAIVELAKWISEITKLIDLEKGTTLNIAKFEGGLDNGQVPDYAEATVRLLYLDPEEVKKVDALMERMQKEPFDPRCHIEVEIKGISRPPMYLNENSKALFEALGKAGEQTGNKVDWVTTGGMSDGNWVAHHGVGTLDGCGPCGAGLHTRDEYIKTWTVGPRFDIMRRLLLNLFPVK